MKLELNRITAAVAATVLCLFCVSLANAALVVPFTEDFATNPADWRQADQVTDAIWTATGGPDGSSFVSAPFNFFGQAVGDKSILRGQDEFGPAGSSGGAFVGDWLAGGVTQFSVFVRHNGPNPLEMFTRFASPVNFPGAASVESTLIPPNTWTQLLFNIASGDPEMTLAGPPTPDFCNIIFGDIAHVQTGGRASAQDGALDQESLCDIDQPRTAPEPGAIALMGLGQGVVARGRVRRIPARRSPPSRAHPPGGSRRRDPAGSDRALCPIPRDVVDFVLATQPKAWAKLKQHHGAEVRERFLRRLTSDIERRGGSTCCAPASRTRAASSGSRTSAPRAA